MYLITCSIEPGCRRRAEAREQGRKTECQRKEQDLLFTMCNISVQTHLGPVNRDGGESCSGQVEGRPLPQQPRTLTIPDALVIAQDSVI